MQILQVVHALPAETYGGPELYTQWLAETLGREHDVAVAAPRGTETAIDGATVHALPDAGGWVDDTGAKSGLERAVADETVEAVFDDLLAEVDPDVVHFQHLKLTSATLPERCQEHGVPALLTLHDFWAKCHRTQLHRPDGRNCSGPESVEKCTACYADALERTECDREDATTADGGPDPPEPTPVGDDAQSPGESSEAASPPAIDEIDVEETEAAGATDPFDRSYDLDLLGRPDVGLADLGRAVTERTERLDAALEATDLLIAPSAFLRDRFVDFGTPAEQIVQCRNGVRIEDYRDTGYDADDGVALGYAGRLAPVKGVHVLVDAFRTLDGDASLHLFGAFDPDADDYHARLRDAAAGERITFHGSYQENARPFERMDALVLPSLWYENSPLVIQEAFAAGVPVVTGDDGGMAELVSDGEDGLTYAVGDPVALAECLQGLLDDPERIERLRAGIERPPSMTEHARQVEFLYDVCTEGALEEVPDLELPS